MNVIVRWSAIIMLGMTAISGGVLANSNESQEQIAEIVVQNIENEDEITAMIEQNLKVESSPSGRRFSKWYIAAPVIGVIAATGGLAALPLLTGVVSAEVAMGAALALAVI